MKQNVLEVGYPSYFEVCIKNITSKIMFGLKLYILFRMCFIFLLVVNLCVNGVITQRGRSINANQNAPNLPESDKPIFVEIVI